MRSLDASVCRDVVESQFADAVVFMSYITMLYIRMM